MLAKPSFRKLSAQSSVYARAWRDPDLYEAMKDAQEIREWTHGKNVYQWRVHRLALALVDKPKRG